jgi:diguanylate cyclase (GGDEF)-like protein
VSSRGVISSPEVRPLPEPLRVLCVEDEPEFTEIIQRRLRTEGFALEIQRVESRAELEAALDRARWDVVLSDHKLPGFSCHEALAVIKARELDLPFIILSGYIGEEAAVAVMREGAHDYVPKSSLGRLGLAVRQALKDASERAALKQSERDLQALHSVAFAAGSALDAERLAAFAAERARVLLDADVATLYWWDDARGVLVCMARSSTFNNDGPEHVSVGEGMAGVAFERRETLFVNDYRTWPHRLAERDSRLVSAFAVPLFVGERVSGAFIVGSLKPRRFGEQHARVLSVLAAEVAPVIETGHLLAAAEHTASYDSLTGLPNRTLFTERLKAHIAAAADGRSFALLFADLDDFQQVNDAFGYDAGNAVMRELGVRLRELGGVGDAVGRFGADEFGMLFPLGSDVEYARRAAQGAVEFLQQPFVIDGHPVHLSTSIGIVAYPEHGETPELLLRHAEAAMRAAKRMQARYAVYSPTLDANSQRRIAVASELRAALAGEQLVLYYQPQIDCVSGLVIGAEALLRWRHPERGLVPPAEFIPIAEQTGLIIELTPWVIARALRQARDWRGQGLNLRVSVNVGMRNLRELGFASVVESLLTTSGVPPSSLTLEITEGTVMLEAERSLEVLRRLRDIGIGVSIDDFGTGYSSLGYLSRLPVDEIKIDRSFVMNLAEPGNRAIVESVVGLGRAFDMRVVAEGVKDRPTRDAIVALRCPVAQGYYYSAPVSAAAFVEWVRQHREDASRID